MVEPLASPMSCTDWIRIFASQLARRRPNVCAAEVLALAIDHFRRCHALPPEVAAAQYDVALDPRAGPPDASRRAG